MNESSWNETVPTRSLWLSQKIRNDYTVKWSLQKDKEVMIWIVMIFETSKKALDTMDSDG